MTLARRVSFEVAHFLVPEGRQRIAWGASPREKYDYPAESPGGATPNAALPGVAPPGLENPFRSRFPGARAPGYSLSPLRGYTIVTYPDMQDVVQVGIRLKYDSRGRLRVAAAGGCGRER